MTEFGGSFAWFTTRPDSQSEEKPLPPVFKHLNKADSAYSAWRLLDDLDNRISLGKHLDGAKNSEVIAVAPTPDNLTNIAKALDELGRKIGCVELIPQQYFRSF